MTIGLFLCTFLFVANAARVCAAPTVFWASDPVRPNETVVAQGDNLQSATSVSVARVNDRSRGEPSLQQVSEVKPLQASEVSLKFALPASLKLGVYAFRVKASGGASGPVYVNRPDVWWIQGDLGVDASPGGWLRAFGKCLSLDTRQSTAVALRGPVEVTLKSKGDGYSLQAELPRNLPAGEYLVRTHNGFGGEAGWSPPRKLIVRESTPWPEALVDLVEFGPDPTGQEDSTLAFKQALSQAEQRGGGIVRVPRGRYMLSETLTLPRFTALRGEDRQLATLFWVDAEKPLPVLIQGSNSFKVENLSIYATRYKHIISGDLGATVGAGDVTLQRLLVRGVVYRPSKTQDDVDKRFREGPGDTVRLGGQNVIITDCDFYGSGRALFLSRTRGGLVARNKFYNGRWGWYCISGSDGLIFEDNEIIGADLMATGGGLNCLDGSSYSQNIYYARNKLSLMHGWDREAMTSDAGGGAYHGKIASSDGKMLTLADDAKWGGRNWAGAGVFIVDGKGRGQYRRIVSTDGRNVELDRGWDVPPDQTSYVSITMVQEKYLLIDNDISDATCAIQFYGISLHHIVAGNRSSRAGGFHNLGLNYYGFQPSWYVQFLNNEIVEGNQGFNAPLNQFPPLDSHIAAGGVWYEPTKAPLNRCTIMRGNQLRNNARIEVGGGTADTLVEGNLIEKSDVGIEVGGAGSHRVGEPSSVFLRNNNMLEVRKPYTGSGLDNAYLHPVERLLGRLQSARFAITAQGQQVPSSWAAIETGDQRLLTTGTNGPAVEKQCSILLGEAVASLDGSADVDAVLLDGLLGLKLSAIGNGAFQEALGSNSGGTGAVELKASLAIDGVGLRLAPQWTWPEGWKGEATSVTELKLGGTVTIPASVTVPAQAWGIWNVPVKIDMDVGEGRLQAQSTFPLGCGNVRNWLVVGPFENKDKTPLDNQLHPPEERLDVKGEYDGINGKVRWQPAALKGNTLDLSQFLTSTSNATGYAVTVLKAKQATAAKLLVRTHQALRLWLNQEPVVTHAQAHYAELSKTVTLQPGDNVVMVLTSTTSGKWQFSLEVNEQGEGGNIQAVPADQLSRVPALNPPALTKGSAEGIGHASGVAWNLVYSDAFDGVRLGPEWRATSGRWEVKGGSLHGENQAFLALNRKFRAPVRIEYRAKAVSPADLSAFWLEAPPDFNTGVLIAFGAGGGSRVDVNGENCTREEDLKPTLPPTSGIT